MKLKVTKSEKLSDSRELDVQVALDVMGWKDVHTDGKSARLGKKQDKAGRWRKSKVPNYSSNPSLIGIVEERVKDLRLFEQYEKELTKIAGSKALPEPWASPAQKCQAALNVVKRKNRQSKGSNRRATRTQAGK